MKPTDTEVAQQEAVDRLDRAVEELNDALTQAALADVHIEAKLVDLSKFQNNLLAMDWEAYRRLEPSRLSAIKLRTAS